MGSSRIEPTTETLGRCGGKRYRDQLPIGVAVLPILAIESA
jgi:hypothetical protein